MTVEENIDEILEGWPYNPESVNVRFATGSDGREILQMRVDMGLLQMETRNRPDGSRPHGFDTFFDYVIAQKTSDSDFQLDDQQCMEVDREFVQFYHRRVCWLTLRYFDRAVEDADHTLALMDLCVEVSPDEQWTISHEQYRPFVIFHRTQAAALSKLEEDHPSPEQAIHELNVGLDRLHGLFVEHEAEEMFEEDDLVVRLTEMRESLRDHYKVGKTLQEQLEDAVADEKYELAAKLRDELQRDHRGGSH